MSNQDEMNPAKDNHSDKDPATSNNGNYAHNELKTNRRTIVLATIGFIICSWLYSPGSGAIVLTILAIIVAAIFWWLFASRSAVKLDEDSPGMGKQVGPLTMGTILGYLHNGFKR